MALRIQRMERKRSARDAACCCCAAPYTGCCVAQEMTATAHAYLEAGGVAAPLDAGALQAELFTLRGVLRAKERAIQEMEAAGGALRWGRGEG